MSPTFLRRLFGLDDPIEVDWSSWEEDLHERAPAGKVRVCVYHIDFDERPSYYADVDGDELATKICDNISDLRPENTDYAVAYDERGERVAKGPW